MSKRIRVHLDMVASCNPGDAVAALPRSCATSSPCRLLTHLSVGPPSAEPAEAGDGDADPGQAQEDLPGDDPAGGGHHGRHGQLSVGGAVHAARLTAAARRHLAHIERQRPSGWGAERAHARAQRDIIGSGRPGLAVFYWRERARAFVCCAKCVGWCAPAPSVGRRWERPNRARAGTGRDASC